MYAPMTCTTILVCRWSPGRWHNMGPSDRALAPTVKLASMSLRIFLTLGTWHFYKASDSPWIPFWLHQEGANPPSGYLIGFTWQRCFRISYMHKMCFDEIYPHSLPAKSSSITSTNFPSQHCLPTELLAPLLPPLILHIPAEGAFTMQSRFFPFFV